MPIPVAREGWPFILGFVAVAATGSWLLPHPITYGTLWSLAFWCLWFFRDPERPTPQEANSIIAPADGKVIVIEEVAAAPLSHLPARKVSIFMNVFNVHVNRFPEQGQVIDLAYHPGRFLNAAVDKASLENERMEVLMKTSQGTPITFVQVAGLIARRIVCRLRQGDRLERGQRFGLIRFGSRVDVYLPLSARVLCVLGDTTVAGQTVIAQLTPGEEKA